MATAVPPPPLSALPGGFLKQLVRETEKETKQKEPEVKDERAVSGIAEEEEEVHYPNSSSNFLFPPAAEQTEQQPGAAVPPPGPDSSDPRGRDVPPASAADQQRQAHRPS